MFDIRKKLADFDRTHITPLAFRFAAALVKQMPTEENPVLQQLRELHERRKNELSRHHAKG